MHLWLKSECFADESAKTELKDGADGSALDSAGESGPEQFGEKMFTSGKPKQPLQIHPSKLRTMLMTQRPNPVVQYH